MKNKIIKCKDCLYETNDLDKANAFCQLYYCMCDWNDFCSKGDYDPWKRVNEFERRMKVKWQVKLNYKYTDLFFVFETLEGAGDFVKTALMSYAHDDEDQSRGIKMSIVPVKDGEKEEDD